MRKKFPKGLHAHRIKINHEEELFSNAWEKQNKEGNTLAYLLHCGDQPVTPLPDPSDRDQPVTPLPDPSDRDYQVAATVIQWLGSEVGENFLKSLNYEKAKFFR